MIFGVCGFVVFDLLSGGDLINKMIKESKYKTDNVIQNDSVSSNKKNPQDESKVSSDSHLRILAFGDIMLSRYVRVLMDKYGMDFVFSKIKSQKTGEWFYKNTDFVFANLEGPINGEGTSGGTSMVFSFNKNVAKFLKEYGFNILSIANNHAIDQGWGGRKNTIDALNDAKVGWCGHPSEEEASSVYYGENGFRVSKDAHSDGEKTAFVCFQDVTSKLNIENAKALIKEVKKNADYVIVSVHWGIEYRHTPTKSQIDFGHVFVDAGADFVIGHHPHVVESFEKYNGKIIFYSLGNFVFDQYFGNDTQEELSIGIDLSRKDDTLKTTIDLFPMKSEKSQSSLMNNDEKKQWIQKFISYGNYDEEAKSQIENFEIVASE